MRYTLVLILAAELSACFAQDPVLNIRKDKTERYVYWKYEMDISEQILKINEKARLTNGDTLANTQILLEGNYLDDKKVGEWHSYNFDYGKYWKHTIVYFNNDTLSGKVVSYYRTGRKFLEGTINRENNKVAVRCFSSDSKSYEDIEYPISDFVAKFTNLRYEGE